MPPYRYRDLRRVGWVTNRLHFHTPQASLLTEVTTQVFTRVLIMTFSQILGCLGLRGTFQKSPLGNLPVFDVADLFTGKKTLLESQRDVK